MVCDSRVSCTFSTVSWQPLDHGQMRWTLCPQHVSLGNPFPAAINIVLAAPRTDEERARDFGRSDFSSRRACAHSWCHILFDWSCVVADRAPLPPREDVPLPTQPPYTAFVGNLAFDMSDMELEEFFSPHKVGVFYRARFRCSFLPDCIGKDHHR